MASIKGITIKNIKKFIGTDGEGYQGNIYKDNKKIGIYSDYADGAEPIIHYLSKEIEKTITKIIEEYYENGEEETLLIPAAERFYAELKDLIENEKIFKKTIEKGYSWIITADISFKKILESESPLPLSETYQVPRKYANEKDLQEILKDIKEKGLDDVKVYKSLNDFIK